MNVRSQLHRASARVLRPFTKVHPDEAATVGLMTLTAFLLLTAYYLLKTVREPLILLQGGAEVKLYARAGQAVLMVGVVHLYGELARRVGRTQLLSIVFLFFISNLAVFAVLAKADVADRAAVLPVGRACSATRWSRSSGRSPPTSTATSRASGCSRSSAPAARSARSVGGLFAKSLVPFGPHVLMGTAVVILLACVALIV